jgi:hypothetical protein
VPDKIVTKLKYSGIICVLLMTTANVWARETIYLKNGIIKETAVVSVFARHLIDSTGSGIMLRQIDSLYTPDQRIAEMFAGLDSSITASPTPEGFAISLVHYHAPLYYTIETKALTPHSISLLYRYDIYGRLGFFYDGTVLEQSNVIHRFQGSIALTRSHVYSSLNFAFGIGGKWEFDRITYSAVMNGGIYGGIPDVDRDSRIHQVVFLSLNAGYHIAGPVHTHMGIDYFLFRESAIVPERELLAYVGIAIRL